MDTEGNKIVNTFIRNVKRIVERLDDILNRLQNFQVVSANNPLEAEIEKTITYYQAYEYSFRNALVNFYKKKFKRNIHSVDFLTAIVGKEDELKNVLEEAKKKALMLQEKILKGEYRVDPLLFAEFCSWCDTLDFEKLKKRYEGKANPKILTESQIQSRLKRTLAKVLEDIGR